MIAAAATLHDIGKVRIDPAILNKPGKLTEEEYAVMKQHAVLGEEILKSGDLSAFQDEPQLKNAFEICRWHHERYDGRGYPDGLSGDDMIIRISRANGSMTRSSRRTGTKTESSIPLYWPGRA